MLASEWTDPTKPLYAELAPLVSAGRDADAAAALNRRDRTGYVPRRHVAATLAKHWQVYGLARWVRDSRTMPALGGLLPSPMNFDLYALFASILLVVEFDEALKASVGDLQMGLSDIPTAMVPQQFRTDLFAGEVKVSRAEEVLGRDVSANEIGTIRNGGT